MGKLYVDAQARTSVDGLRESLDEAQRLLADLGSGRAEPTQLLHRLDRIAEALQELEDQGADLRVERTRFDSLLQRVRQQRRIVVGSDWGAIEAARAESEPQASQWWWFLDQQVAQERREAWLRRIGLGIAVVALLAGAWLAYDRFLAPPPEMRQAYRHIESGKRAFDEGDLTAATSHFETARGLTPQDPEPWLWGGVLCESTAGCTESESLFKAAERLYPTRFDFLVNRGRVYLESGDPDEASADVDAALKLNPDSGWGYYLRAGVEVRQGDYSAALDDLDLAADLAEQNGQSRLHGMAVTQRAQLVRMHPPETPD